MNNRHKQDKRQERARGRMYAESGESLESLDTDIAREAYIQRKQELRVESTIYEELPDRPKIRVNIPTGGYVLWNWHRATWDFFYE